MSQEQNQEEMVRERLLNSPLNLFIKKLEEINPKASIMVNSTEDQPLDEAKIISISEI